MKPYQIFLSLFIFSILPGCFQAVENPKENIPEASCISAKIGINWQALQQLNCDKLSSYGLLTKSENTLIPINESGISYKLNSALFTDHTRKYRYLFLPKDTTINYSSNNSFELPTGSVLVKISSMPIDTSQNKENIIEVRLLIKREKNWYALPYIWDENSSDGYLDDSGESKDIALTHNNNGLISHYTIPSPADCLVCHQGEDGTTPIGLKSRHLNLNITYDNQAINQLTHWKNLGILTNLPSSLSSIDTAPNWEDESQPLQNRAKAYLDINCAHCHNDFGSGALSGLRLEYWRKNINYNHGVCNSSHGWSGGGFDIWPGRGEISSIPIRMRHTGAKDRMPPIGRSLVDEKAADLISQWIDSLPYEDCAP